MQFVDVYRNDSILTDTCLPLSIIEATQRHHFCNQNYQESISYINL